MNARMESFGFTEKISVSIVISWTIYFGPLCTVQFQISNTLSEDLMFNAF